MPNDLWDKIGASQPVNKQAGMSSARGEEYTFVRPDNPSMSLEWSTPPKLRRLKYNELDLTGLKFGRFTVIGRLDVSAMERKSNTWVCRCTCGKYAARKTKAVRNPNNTDDRCDECRNTAYLRDKRWSWRE